MKLINIKCFDNGSAELTTSDLHISSENKASKLVIDFSETIYQNSSKWVDLILSNGTSLRYELGNSSIVEHELLDEETIAGVLKITPFVIENDRKIKYIPNYDVIIKKQPDAGDNEAPQRDDYIFNVVKNVTSHIANNNNPHNVTKEQIGLGNVNNTSDADKPISTAQQTKFDLIDTQISNLNYNKVDKFTTINGKRLDESIILTKNDFADLNNVDNTSDLDKPISTATLNELNKKISLTEKGVKNGVATLNELGKVPSSQLPSFVDDVVEGYLYNGKFYQDAEHQIELSPETSKIYVDKISNNTFRWSGSQYIEISQSLALGETENTAFRGDRGKIAYDKSIANEEAINETLDLINRNHIEVNNRIDSIVNENIVEIEFTEPITYIEDAIVDAPQEIMEIRGKSEVIITDEVLEIASWKVSEELKNEIITDAYGQKRIIENVVKVNLWEYGTIWKGTPKENHYLFSFMDYFTTNNLKNTIWFINGFPQRIDNIPDYRYSTNNYSQNLLMTIEKPLIQEIMTRDSVNEVTAFKTYLQENHIMGVFELAIKNPVEVDGELIDGGPQVITETEGIASVVNPVIESKSLEENSTKLQIIGTYNSIPATDIKDKVYNDNGVYYDEINIKKIVVEETTNDGTNYFIDYPSDYKQNSNIFVENIKLTDDGTKLLYPMKYGNPIGKEMIYQLAEPIVKQSEIAIMDDLVFRQGYTIYLSSEQLAPTMLAKCAYNLGAQVKMLVDDSRSQAKSIEENKDNIANLQNEVNKFIFVSETEFGNITKEDGKVYGVYNEETGIITWYYGNIGGDS